MNRPSFDASSDPRQEGSARSAEGFAGCGDRRKDLHPEDQKVPFLGIHFKCCKTYGRIYRSPLRLVYEGHCPKCRGLLTVPIGPGGLDTRFLSAQ
ncbi:MAG TPA: hypothetical protein DEF45_19295 [Rhodopirellula sp.]|nr:hypothetical protein [Rhodopirellula sp.]